MSIGVAAFPADGRSPGDLVAAADRALYRVKRRGGGGVDAAVERDEVRLTDTLKWRTAASWP